MKGCGGGTGIRTPEGLAPQHAFQACALNHSAIPPARAGWQSHPHIPMRRNLTGGFAEINHAVAPDADL